MFVGEMLGGGKERRVGMQMTSRCRDSSSAGALMMELDGGELTSGLALA